MIDWLVGIHEFQTNNWGSFGGRHFFLIETLLLAFAICKWGIPITTDMMVNASAGLAGKHFGDKSRTMVINASTNNPELANMLVSIGVGRAGGIANPLGSNFANIYLMYLVAPVWVIFHWAITGQSGKAKQLVALLGKEKKLVITHVFMAFLMFLFSSVAYWFMTGYHQFSRQTETPTLHSSGLLLAGAGISIFGVILFLFWNKHQQNKRPELFDDIDSEEHTESWKVFAVGTGGLIIASFLLNAIFLGWSAVYGTTLRGFLGTAVFAGLHYFAGALVTSLPELKVAVDNYRKLSPSDLNTALSSASVSNMTNLVIAIFGILLIILLGAFGMNFVL
jgi:nitrate reductase NapE component